MLIMIRYEDNVTVRISVIKTLCIINELKNFVF